MDLSFISDTRALVSDVIQFGAWFLILYRIYKRPEQIQDQRINQILDKLTTMEQSEIAGLENSVRILLKRLFTRTCLDLINRGYTTEADLDIIESLYSEYHNRWGENGRGTELYNKVLDLPTKVVDI